MVAMALSQVLVTILVGSAQATMYENDAACSTTPAETITGVVLIAQTYALEYHLY